MVARNDLSVEYLKECFTADFEAGTLTWNVRPLHHFKDTRVHKLWNTRYSGTGAGNLYTRKSGYQSFQVGIQDTSYLVHRILWTLHSGAWPEEDIGHINGDPLDNRIENLSSISHADNMKFTKLKKSNKSGLNGVGWCRRRGRWIITNIRSAATRPYISQSISLFEAACARKSHELAHGMGELHGTSLT